MKKSVSGFTIVELLIVIVIIGIIAAITLVAYSGIQKRALNTARLQEMRSWQKVFDIYNVTYGLIPGITTGAYCLGTGFPDGDGIAGGECRDYTLNSTNTYHENTSTALMSELRKVATLPSGPRVPVNGTVGPYVKFWNGSASYTITSTFNGTSSQCPSPLTYAWDDGNGMLQCQLDVTY